MPEELIPALAGRTVRCILFDLGDTLWSRKDMAVWERMENASNVLAVTVLRKCVTSPFLPNVNDSALGKRLRESVDECLRNLIRQEPGLEPRGSRAIVQVLQQWGIEGVDIGFGEAIFEALRSIHFRGWGIVELDRERAELSRTAKESAQISKDYLEQKVGVRV